MAGKVVARSTSAGRVARVSFGGNGTPPDGGGGGLKKPVNGILPDFAVDARGARFSECS